MPQLAFLCVCEKNPSGKGVTPEVSLRGVLVLLNFVPYHVRLIISHSITIGSAKTCSVKNSRNSPKRMNLPTLALKPRRDHYTRGISGPKNGHVSNKIVLKKIHHIT